MQDGAGRERSKAVLVVEDDPDVRETLADAVESTGRRVFVASDGSAALGQLDSPDIPRPCLIVLDWKMAPMGGAQFLDQLKARPDASQLPVVVITGDSSLLERAIPGVLDIVQKPDFDALLRLLDQHA